MPEVRDSMAYLAIFLVLTSIDLLFSTAAGAAAAATGAHVNWNSDSVTATLPYDVGFVVRLGALAGIMKASILALVQFGSIFGGLNLGTFLILLLVFSSFGVAVIVTSAICNIVLNTVPSQLLIAALVTAIPGSAELVGVQMSTDGEIGFNLGIIGVDALAGYVFARMAHNGGYDICSYAAGAAAGAVCGSITMFKAFTLSAVAPKGITADDDSLYP